MCISSGVIFTGNIDINGGTLCNSGTINGGNLNFNSGKIYNNGLFRKSGLSFNGEFHNYGTAEINGDLNINGSGSFYNYPSAQLNVTSSVNNNHIFVNQGAVSINGSYSANSGSGNSNQNTGSMSVGGAFNVNVPFTNSGTMTVGGNMSVNSGGTFTNNANSTISVNGQYQNNAATLNSGTITIQGNFTNNSSGNFVNNMTTAISGNFTNNGSISGDAVGCNSFTVQGTSIVQNSSGSLSNNDFCSYGVSGFFTRNNGSLSNVTYCSCSNTGVTPLPIVLKSFSASCTDQGIEFTWVTATELNNDYFTIYQSSDLSTWEPIHSVTGAGNSNVELEYSYKHARNAETHYYRLEQTDFDGTTKTFAPISVSCSDLAQPDNALHVFPNPVEEAFSIEVNLPNPQIVTVELVDISGRKILSKVISLAQGTHIIPADRNGAGAGTYVLRVTGDNDLIGCQRIIFK